MEDILIIKALECCISGKLRPCDNCPYRNNCRNGVAMKTDALDLINRQKAEIERLRVDNNYLFETMPHMKAEAIKEFWGMVKCYSQTNTFFADSDEKFDLERYGDNLVKEMAGE